jgi:protein gp37
MGDIFDAAFGISIHQVLFKIMEDASWHTFVSLTKQTRNMLVFNQSWQSFPRNVWMGVSVNRREDLHRIDDLRATDAAVKFVSFEPLYEDLKGVDLSGIQWVIVGAQRRPDLQPKFRWVERVVDEAERVGATVFLKNNLSLDALDAHSIPHFTRRQELPEAAKP